MDSDGDSDSDGGGGDGGNANANANANTNANANANANTNTNTNNKEDFIRSRRRRKPTRLSHIALIPGLSPLEYPWDRDLLQGVFKYDYFQKKDCSNNIWFPPYYPWYPTFNKTPIAS